MSYEDFNPEMGPYWDVDCKNKEFYCKHGNILKIYWTLGDNPYHAKKLWDSLDLDTEINYSELFDDTGPVLPYACLKDSDELFETRLLFIYLIKWASPESYRRVIDLLRRTRGCKNIVFAIAVHHGLIKLARDLYDSICKEQVLSYLCSDRDGHISRELLTGMDLKKLNMSTLIWDTSHYEGIFITDSSLFNTCDELNEFMLLAKGETNRVNDFYVLPQEFVPSPLRLVLQELGMIEDILSKRTVRFFKEIGDTKVPGDVMILFS